jgi:alkaline phosphatase D
VSGPRRRAASIAFGLLLAAFGIPLAAFGILLTGVAARAAPESFPLAVMDAGDGRYVVWARVKGPWVLELSDLEATAEPLRIPVEAPPDADHQAAVDLRGLAPGHRYLVRATVPGAEPASEPHALATVRFQAPPAADVKAAARVAFGGDVGGQNVCRDVSRGYPAFEAIAATEPVLFIGLGDMIYADSLCKRVGRYRNAQLPGPPGPATDLEGFRARWRYNRDDAATREVLARTLYVPVWDDHEVVNDFGPLHDRLAEAPDTPLLPLGLRAFLEANPVAHPGDDAPVLYRKLRWGRHLAFFVLDTRLYRDSNADPDDPEAPKSLLGAAQRAWLLDSLRASDATWNVVVSSVPIAIPTGGIPADSGRDGWSGFDQETGFEAELRSIFESLRDDRVGGLVWITTDAHFASVFRYRPFPGSAFTVHEMVTGPLHAMAARVEGFDDSFGPERLFLHAPPDPNAVGSLDEALGWFNFGTLDVDAAGTLTLRILDARGKALWQHELER